MLIADAVVVGIHIILDCHKLVEPKPETADSK